MAHTLHAEEGDVADAEGEVVEALQDGRVVEPLQRPDVRIQ